MYAKKRREDNTGPCGTPAIIDNDCEEAFLTVTVKVRQVMKLRNILAWDRQHCSFEAYEEV